MNATIPFVCILYCLEVSKIMPPSKNPKIIVNFDERLGGKHPILACKHCNWTRANATRAKEHLDPRVDQCPSYKALQGIDPTLTSSSASALASSKRLAKR